LSGASRPRHAPYAGARRPFSIGLAPIEAARWLDPDGQCAAELAEKTRLLAEHRGQVVLSSPDTVAAEREVLDLVAGFLGAVPAPVDASPIVDAALLVQDDLCLMRRHADGWRLVAACLCFPSSWSLIAKANLPMAAIHAPVPGFAGTMAERVERIFDKLPEDTIVERFNWSIYDDGELFHPAPKARRRRFSEPGADIAATAFVRVERQTLRRLPVSGDILFTIRNHVDPLAAFGPHPNRATLARGLAAQLRGLDAAQLAYKNLAADRDKLATALDELAGEGDV